MSLNEFIFEPGTWLGEGKITFSASPEFIKFYTRWKIERESEHVLKAVQVVEMHAATEQLVNTFTITEVKPQSFLITLENNIIERVSGKGIRDDHTIAWEFRGDKEFEGFEVYEQQENGDFFMHAEYGSTDQYRTIIEGLIWKKG